jgi:hypothetical protein
VICKKQGSAGSIPIGREFSYGGKYQKVADLISDYFQVYSNDWRAWSACSEPANVLATNYAMRP